jgi:hypothetical protein
MSKLSVSDIRTDDDFVSSSKTVRIGTSGDTKFNTPLKPSLKQMDGLSPVREMYRRISPETLDKCSSNSEYDRKYSESTKRQMDPGSVNIFTLAYGSTTQMPTIDQIKQMSDIQYVHTDVVVVPSWFDLIRGLDKSQCEMYFNLSDAFYHYSSCRNNKPVMATIPTCIPNDKIPKVLKHFIDMDITSFILDFNGRSLINGTWLRSFIREWDSYNIEKEGIIYSMNAYQGIDKKNIGNFEAKDFVGFLGGIDIIGDKHIAKGCSDKTIPGFERTKVFDSDTYHYRKVFCSPNETEKYAMESISNQITEIENMRSFISRNESIKDAIDSKSLDPRTRIALHEMKYSKKFKTKKLDAFF